MGKNKRYILLVIGFLLLLGISIYSMNKRDKSMADASKKAQLALAEREKVPLIRKEYKLNFDKNTTSFTSDEVEVSKEQTLKEMSLAFEDDINDKITIKIYQDGKLIKEIKKEADNTGYTIPYEMKNDKSTFKLEINYTVPLGENEKFTSNVIWYVNMRF